MKFSGLLFYPDYDKDNDDKEEDDNDDDDYVFLCFLQRAL